MNNKKLFGKYGKIFVKYLIGTFLYSAYVAFILIHWLVPYASYLVKLLIFAVVIYVLANIAAKSSAIHIDIKRKKTALLLMEEGNSREQVEMEPKDSNENIIEKTLAEKVAESLAEAIVKDIEYEVSERLTNESSGSLKIVYKKT